MSATAFCLSPFSSAFARAAFVAVLSQVALTAAHAQLPASPALVGEGAHAVTEADVRAELTPVDSASRQRMLSSPESVQRIATDIYVRRRLAQQAVAQHIDQEPQVQRLLQIVRERVLADMLGKRTESQSRPTGPVLESLARQNYQAQQKRFQQPERVRARHILIPLNAPDARAHAEDLRRQVLAGASFEELAKEFSKDPGSAAKGGDLGFFTRGKMVAPFEEAAFALDKPGAVADVVESKFGFHVIQLVDKRAAGIQPFDEVKEQLMEEAAGGVATTARQELVRPLLDAAQPHPQAIEAFARAQHE
ncbi:MAG TPA: peptidylprolyl isomerase [Comamonadaceae bacterium]|uniref:peptidylprolyl isomerase n=1 Tax=Pulveribacter sp. TaxID=2678893 RepID=UPI000EE83558|nr:peptidylprolyl isomerase [Pulveribacter sp.]HCL86957.1 peptidylprolyl isomerase [Comamonadaceae bacterium]